MSNYSSGDVGGGEGKRRTLLIAARWEVDSVTCGLIPFSSSTMAATRSPIGSAT